MSKNIRYIIITLLICAAAAFGVNAITSTVAHDAQVNAQAQNGYPPQLSPGNWTITPGYWLVCVPGQNATVLHQTQPQEVYTDPGSGITYIFMGTSKPTAAQTKETCSS